MTGAAQQGRVDGFSRRRLFEFGATSVGLAAFLAACGGEQPEAPGRAGVASEVPELENLEVNDVVYLRTLTSLEHSIVDVYEQLLAADGISDDVVALVERLRDDHLAAAEALASLTNDAGGEPYECANTWMMGRTFQPIVDNIIGGTFDGVEIEPTDDVDADVLTTAGALESIDAATAQLYIERLVDQALRGEVITLGTDASRRAATVALRSNPAPEGYVSPLLLGGGITPDERGVVPQFAITSRYGQLTPVEVVVGAADENGQRFRMSVNTPAENAYIYEGASCPVTTTATSVA